VRRHFKTLQSISSFGESGFFFFRGFDHLVLGEFGLGGGNCAAIGAGDDQDHLAEAGARVMGGELGRGFEGFEERGGGPDPHNDKDGERKTPQGRAWDRMRTAFTPDIPRGFPQWIRERLGA